MNKAFDAPVFQRVLYSRVSYSSENKVSLKLKKIQDRNHSPVPKTNDPNSFKLF